MTENEKLPDNAIATALAAQDNSAQRAEWLGNIRANIAVIAKARDISDVRGIFAGLPGIIIGAGPSLKKNVFLLSGREKNYPLFCCDRALKQVQEAGVQPHFTVVADASSAVAGFLKDCDTRRSALIAPVFAAPETLALPWKKIIFYIPDDTDLKFMKAVRNLVSISGRMVSTIQGPVIVGNAAFLCAMTAGCNPMTFIGNDLSAPEPFESGQYFEKTGAGGEKVYSLHGFLAGLEWILRFTRVDKDFICGKFRLYNSTEGGIMYSEEIEGAPLSQFLARFPGSERSLETMIRKGL